MRILIYGAGVIGSLYAVLFAETGYDTSIYARGKRLEFLKKNGLLYKKNQKIRRAEATILGELSDNDAYDFILLTVRENQLYEAFAELKNNKSNIIVTMVNSLDSYKKWEDIVGKGAGVYIYRRGRMCQYRFFASRFILSYLGVRR